MDQREEVPLYLDACHPKESHIARDQQRLSVHEFPILFVDLVRKIHQRQSWQWDLVVEQLVPVNRFRGTKYVVNKACERETRTNTRSATEGIRRYQKVSSEACIMTEIHYISSDDHICMAIL